MHQSVYELVHTEDQQELRRNLHWALNPPPAAASAVTQDSPQGDHPCPPCRSPLNTATADCTESGSYHICKKILGDDGSTICDPELWIFAPKPGRFTSNEIQHYMYFEHVSMFVFKQNVLR